MAVADMMDVVAMEIHVTPAGDILDINAFGLHDGIEAWRRNGLPQEKPLVFGQKRAALYVGSMFFVFTSTDHVRELTAHFDNLIRQARVQPNETSAFITRLARDLA